MENQKTFFLAHIGLKTEKEKASAFKLYTIKNNDGTVRWAWNAQNNNPDFLRFYSVSTFRSLIFSTTIRLIFLLRLQHFFFKRSALWVSKNSAHLLASFTNSNFALFTGTAGPNRKLVLFAGGRFIKIALNESSKKLILNEWHCLSSIKGGEHLEIPEVSTIAPGIIASSDLGIKGKRQNQFSALHAQALKELQSQIITSKQVFGRTSVFNATQSFINNNKGPSNHKIPVFLLDKLQTLRNLLQEEELVFTLAHGDFTPWNCFVQEDKIKLYDFELSNTQLPLAFDAFHFILQQGILVDKLCWKEILPKLKSAFQLITQNTPHHYESFEKYLKAYLFVNIAYHVHLYGKQKEWHQQINWLFNTWNDALSDLIQINVNQRVTLSCDIFDFLQNQKYAALKFPNIHPKHIHEFSDIDILTSAHTAKKTLKYLTNHSLVSRVNIKSQSHMISIVVLLKNGDLLSLDLIWKFKRKWLVFMDAASCLNGLETNDFGIKTLNKPYTGQYLHCFYYLNGSQIPPKYHYYFDNNVEHLQDYASLKLQTATLKANKGLSGCINKCNYAIDSLRSFFNQKGIIITFSGVDGAGKSTIIEKAKEIIEKKLRKKVVVIRHRPSVLPILSALTEGKAKAELKASNTLPRQGENKNLLSSLLRFAYYYTDYLFGQFYIYFKHVCRGEVVLYDRYYFDFINDGLRSNIRLPKWIAKTGYKLLMPPHLNFFLYADAQTILSRKKELDEKAITELTKEYLNLFTALGAKVADRYFPIENLQLEKSLQFISDKAQSKIF